MKKKRKTPPGGFRDHPENINRAGRKPNSMTFGDYLRSFLESEEGEGKRQIIAQMVDIAIARAKKGQFQFWDALMNRAYGKPSEKIEMTQEQPFDPAKLSGEELAELKKLLEKAKP